MPGNRCGHCTNRPSLTPAYPIRKGTGDLPRLLSMAAERAKEWYRHPQKCHVLNKGKRRTRSERREAYQIILETMLSFLDLASLCLGTKDRSFIFQPGMKRHGMLPLPMPKRNGAGASFWKAITSCGNSSANPA